MQATGDENERVGETIATSFIDIAVRDQKEGSSITLAIETCSRNRDVLDVIPLRCDRNLEPMTSHERAGITWVPDVGALGRSWMHGELGVCWQVVALDGGFHGSACRCPNVAMWALW